MIVETTAKTIIDEYENKIFLSSYSGNGVKIESLGTFIIENKSEAISLIQAIKDVAGIEGKVWAMILT